MRIYNEEFLQLYDNRERIPDFILREVLCTNPIILEQYDENRRWSRGATSVVSIPVEGGERFFAIYWDEGLTEYQENEYWSAEEVELQMDMKQVKIEVVTKKYVEKRTGNVAISYISTTELE